MPRSFPYDEQNDLLQNAGITLASAPRSLEKQRHQFAENCRISREPSRLFIFSLTPDPYLFVDNSAESTHVSRRSFPVKRRFDGADGIRATFLNFVRKTGRDEKREEKKGRKGGRERARKLASRPMVMVAVVSQRATLQVPRKHRPCFSSAKSPTLSLPVLLPLFFSSSSRTVFFLVDGSPLVRKKSDFSEKISRRWRRGEEEYARICDRSIDQFHRTYARRLRRCRIRNQAGVCVYDVAGVTILLSQTVFSLLVAHVLTRTSEAVPLIGTDPPFLLPAYPDESRIRCCVRSFLSLRDTRTDCQGSTGSFWLLYLISVQFRKTIRYNSFTFCITDQLRETRQLAN